MAEKQVFPYTTGWKIKRIVRQTKSDGSRQNAPWPSLLLLKYEPLKRHLYVVCSQSGRSFYEFEIMSY